MRYGGGATDRYSWEESDEELNIKARLPAWAKGKSVIMELSEKRIRLALREERDKPVIEGDLRGPVVLDGCYWTMETVDDGGKMLYLTLEKMPEVRGLGPWMGVVEGESQVDSSYPEDQKGERLRSSGGSEGGAEAGASGGSGGSPIGDADVDVPTHDETVDEDGFCRGALTVQGMDDVLIARQVPTNGNALFSAVSASEEFITTGKHPSIDPEAIAPKAKELRKKAIDYLDFAHNEGLNVYVEGRGMSARELIATQARGNTMADGREYLRAMRDNTMWAGGAEVVALTHVLKRPVHVYELESTGRRFALKRMGAFGSPLYAKEPIRVLSTYARFPQLDPGTQAGEGNHFVALFPAAKVPKVEDKA